MTNAKNVAPAKEVETNELELLGTAQLDLNKFIDSPSDEVADLYGEAIYPLFAPSDDKGKTKPYNREKMISFLDRVRPKLKKAAMKGGLNGALAALKAEGLSFDIKVQGKASEAFQLEEKAQFNWTALFKWLAGGAVVAVIAYGGYRLYVSYQEGRKASGSSVAM